LKKKSCVFNLYLGRLKRPWITYCQNLNQKPGAALKKIVQDQLNQQVEPLEQIKEVSKEVRTHRFEFLLTPSEKAALVLQARREYCPQSRWVISAIQAGLKKQPQFIMKDIEKLSESNDQLLVVGRALNQIAKALNEGGEPTNMLELVKQVRHVIEIHTKTVNQAMHANLKRWDIE